MSTKERKEFERGFFGLIHALTGPTVVYNTGWAETLPDWIKEKIPLERMVQNMKGVEEATDIEIVAYLYTASLTAPISHDMSNIYLLMAAKYTKMDIIEPRDFNDREKAILSELRRKIYSASTKRTKERLKGDTE